MSYGSMDAILSMNRVMEYMASKGYPLVFKGAMLLKNIVGFIGVPDSRMTKDIDADWVVPNVTNEGLFALVTDAVSSLENPTLYVEQHRLFSEGVGAGFKVFRRKAGVKDMLYFSMDIGMKRNDFAKQYISINGVTFWGSSIEKIISDKVSAVSSVKIARRTKDIYDIYLIGKYLEGFNLYDIRRVIQLKDKPLDDFNSFLTNKEGRAGMRHAYDALRDVSNKPSFDTIWEACYRFCLPFITGDYQKCNGVWLRNPHTGYVNWHVGGKIYMV